MPLTCRRSLDLAPADGSAHARTVCATHLSIQAGRTQGGRRHSIVRHPKSVGRIRLFVTCLWMTVGLCVPLGCAVPSINRPVAQNGRSDGRVANDQARLRAIAEAFERQGRTAKANEIYARVGRRPPELRRSADHFAMIAARQNTTSSPKQPSSGPVARRTNPPPRSEPVETGTPREFALRPDIKRPSELPAGQNEYNEPKSTSLYGDPRVEAAASMMGWIPTQRGARENNPPQLAATEPAAKPAKKVHRKRAGQSSNPTADNVPAPSDEKLTERLAARGAEEHRDSPAACNPFAVDSEVCQKRQREDANRHLAVRRNKRLLAQNPQTVAERRKIQSDHKGRLNRLSRDAAAAPRLTHRQQRSSAAPTSEITESRPSNSGRTATPLRDEPQAAESEAAVAAQQPVQNPFANATSRRRTEKHYGPIARQCRPLNQDAEEMPQRPPGARVAAASPAAPHIAQSMAPQQQLEPKPYTIVIQPAVRPKREQQAVLPPAPPAPLAATGNPFAPQVDQTGEPTATNPQPYQPLPQPPVVAVDEPRQLAVTDSADYLPAPMPTVNAGPPAAEPPHEIAIIPAGPNMKRELARALSPQPEKPKQVGPSTLPIDPVGLITSDDLQEIHTDRVRGLLKQLKDPDPRQRAQAAYGLGQAHSEARTALPLLRRMLRTEGDSLARLRIAEAIARIAPHDEQAIAVIADGLSDTDNWQVRELSACLLDVAGPQPNPQVVIKLIGAMNDYHPRVRTMAALTLGSFGPQAGDAVARLRVAAKSDVGKVKEAASAALNVIEASSTTESSKPSPFD